MYTRDDIFTICELKPGDLYVPFADSRGAPRLLIYRYEGYYAYLYLRGGNVVLNRFFMTTESSKIGYLKINVDS